MAKDIAQFEKDTGISFSNKALLTQAFVHRSYINENRDSELQHNERLEFLGDAVLELVVTHYLYANFPLKDEGYMTGLRSALVNATTCAQIATNLNLNDYLYLSKGELKDTGRARQYILANAFEAVIGAIYLDAGYEVARSFIYKNLEPLIADIVATGSWIDSKSLFQEKAQDYESVTPVYKTIKESGPDHEKKFTVGVYLGKSLVASGEGNSKQDAEQVAARKALERKGWE